MTDPRIEPVAVAIYYASRLGLGPWTLVNEPARAKWRSMAAAAVEAYEKALEAPDVVAMRERRQTILAEMAAEDQRAGAL